MVLRVFVRICLRCFLTHSRQRNHHLRPNRCRAHFQQFVYTNPEKSELVQVVREGDCVLIPKGYHPNVAAPGGQINFLWMMAAMLEGEDRQYGVVNVQPEYAAGGSGLEAARGK